MPHVRNTMEVIRKTMKYINPGYDLHVANVRDIKNESEDLYDIIHNAFILGYAQATKAAAAKAKKAGRKSVREPKTEEMEIQKKLIKIINEGKSLEWLEDIHAFIKCYPDHGRKKACVNSESNTEESPAKQAVHKVKKFVSDKTDCLYYLWEIEDMLKTADNEQLESLYYFIKKYLSA